MDRWKATALALAGILVGVVFAGPQVTGAEGHEAKQFKECVALHLEVAKLRRDGNRIGSTTRVPEGWTVVSGVGWAGVAGLLACR